MRNRIREIRKLRGLTLAEVAEKAHTTPQHLSRLEKKENIDTKWLEVLAQIFEVKTSDLFYLDEAEGQYHSGNVLRVSDSGAGNNFGKHACNKYITLPIVRWQDIADYVNGLPVDIVGEVVTNKTVSQRAFAVAVADNDMEPRFMAGDLLVVDPEKRVIDGEFCLLDPARNGRIICRKFEETSQIYTFSALKPGILDLTSPMTGYENLPIIGAIVEMQPKLF